MLKNGDAYFQVVHKEKNPVVVKTNGSDVIVLGTSFEINAFEKESQSEITVSSGKVGVQLSDLKQPATFVLRPCWDSNPRPAD
ncbi:FecR domain-containing protein [Arachidicoccus sp.]|uniref:FecR domain-containing protein n=1 Tax=Arachidicoccus sp. TaxID=1872624 RepID=UPI003D25CC11